MASARMKLVLIIFLIYVMENCMTMNGVRKVKNRPKVFGDQIAYRSLQTKFKKVRDKIVFSHNYFRSRVRPRAANMLRMKWHKGAAAAAHKWATSCVRLKHDNGTIRTMPLLGQCGQNIFVSSQKVSWFFAIKSWNDERADFIFGQDNQTAVVGHYTQLVWATSHKVGCAVATCKSPNQQIWYNYVCNYCPGGNYNEKLGKPYKIGKPCSACPGKCTAKTLCLNSCPYIDDYSNCGQLSSTIKNFCKKGSNYRDSCKATCFCKNKIHEIFF